LANPPHHNKAIATTAQQRGVSLWQPRMKLIGARRCEMQFIGFTDVLQNKFTSLLGHKPHLAAPEPPTLQVRTMHASPSTRTVVAPKNAPLLATRHNDAVMCDAHDVDAELVDHSTVSTKACRVVLWDARKNAHFPQRQVRGCHSCKYGTATPITSSRADALPTRAESDAHLPRLETAPSRAVAGSQLLSSWCG